jgi:hypothetical protein
VRYSLRNTFFTEPFLRGAPVAGRRQDSVRIGTMVAA